MLSIELKNAYYGAIDRSVLQGVAIDLAPGEFVALIGANGCGKSTLLKCLAGLHAGIEGKVTLEEQQLAEWSLEQRSERIAYLSQSVTPAFSFTAEEVILLSRYYRGGKDNTEEVARRLQQAAEAMEVGALLPVAVDELSGGEWQRVAIARTVMQDARFMLLDEPTAHLDLSHRLSLFQQCRQWSQAGKGILCATHDLDAALEFADRIVVLHDGQVEANGAPEQVMTESLLHKVFGETSVEILQNPLSERPQLVIDSRDRKGSE
ncbi:MAG: ABC transporter ATP-binding protein [Gammaproteobacteria bacterium]|nr:ABC transporter ATP-binding protein [Gammaproteobacteria bacterium]